MSNYKKLNDVYIPDGEPDIKLREEQHEDAPETQDLKLNNSDILRVEEGVGVFWRGVSGCCAQATIDSKCDAAYKRWVESKLYEYRHLRYVRYGHPAASVSCSSGRRDWPDNSRYCSAGTTLECFIEFRKV